MFYRIRMCTNKMNKISSFIRKMATESAALETVELQIPQGRISGAKRESVYGHTYYSFEGIPYAQPPVGALRFRAPKPFGKWTGTLDGTRTPPKPMQYNLSKKETEGREDCLFLNVFTKNIKSAEKLPVMVWIYGGGFQSGYAARQHHGPEYFMRENVVIVSMNYRLSALGFLSLSDPKLDVPGNAGLKDQLLALKWVKKNIFYFNGNCNNITVFGESAGAACAHLLSLSEQTRGLFQQAVIMSGSALNPWVQMPQKDMGYRLAKYHGYDGDNEDSKVLQFLENLDAKKLVKHNILNEEEQKSFAWIPFTPTVEPYVADHCILPTNPLNMLSTAWSNSIPFIMGGTSYEGLLLYERIKMFPKVIDMVQAEPATIVPAEVKAVHPENSNTELGKGIVKLYFDDKDKDDIVAQQIKPDPKFDLLHLLSHKLIWHGLHRSALARTKYATTPTYLYRFAFDSPTFNHHRLRFCGADDVRGAAHADDISYIFYVRESTKLDTDSEEYKTIQRMIGILTSFAKQGNPNCVEIEPNIWLPINHDDPNTALNINKDVQIMKVPEAPKMEAWDSLYNDKKMLYGPETMPLWDV